MYKDNTYVYCVFCAVRRTRGTIVGAIVVAKEASEEAGHNELRDRMGKAGESV